MTIDAMTGFFRFAPTARATPLMLVGLLMAAPATAQITFDQHNADYTECLTLASKNPDAAIARAKAWWEKGANFAARHCLGVALAQKEQYVQAGKIFEDLAADAMEEILPLKADLYGQAGQAYYLAGLNERAIGAFDRAIAIKPGNADLLIDRAVARDDAGQFFEAIDDLNAAIETDANRPEAWLYRAAAYRHIGSFDLALDDANRAISLSQRSPEALFERAQIREARKDLAGAREDFQTLIKSAPKSVQAQEAANRIKNLGQARPPAAAPAKKKP